MSIYQPPKLGGPQIPIISTQQGFDEGCSIWIPKNGPEIENIYTLGYVDTPGRPYYSRDIGRSFTLGGRIYYIYGDTFCNDAGISSNTYQVIPDHTKPRDAYYLSVDATGLVHPLIEVNEDEVRFLKSPGNEKKRIAFWCFGGVVEISPGVGWTWYEKHIISPTGDDELVGAGIARISEDKNKYSGELFCTRMPDLMFHTGEPLFGSFSALVEGDMVYLWGHRDKDVCLARVPKASCQNRHLYQFWNGKEYVTEMQQSAPVLRDFQHGVIFKSDIFGPDLPWLFVGVTRWADNTVRLGSAFRLEGPWDIRPILQAQGIKRPDAYRYCMYAHTWFDNRSKDKLLVSWCDQWPGGVIVAEIRFKTHPRVHWALIDLDSRSEHVVYAAVTKATEVCRASSLQYAELHNPRRLRLWSIDQRMVERAVETIQHQIGVTEKELASQVEATAEGQAGGRRPCLTDRLAKVFGQIL